MSQRLSLSLALAALVLLSAGCKPDPEAVGGQTRSSPSAGSTTGQEADRPSAPDEVVGDEELADPTPPAAVVAERPTWPDGARLRLATHQLLYDEPAQTEDELARRHGLEGVALRWPAATASPDHPIVDYEVTRDGQTIDRVPHLETRTELTWEGQSKPPMTFTVVAVDETGARSAPLQASHTAIPAHRDRADNTAVISMRGGAQNVLGGELGDLEGLGDLSGFDGIGLGGAAAERDRPASDDHVGPDLERLCRIATEVDADTSIAEPDKASTVARRFAETDVDPLTRTLMRGLATVPPGQRYEQIVNAARAHGVADFDCPALEEP